MHLLISSCMNSDVVMDFLITVSTMLSVHPWSLRVNLRIISFKHMRASLVTPERKFPMHCSSSPTRKNSD